MKKWAMLGAIALLVAMSAFLVFWTHTEDPRYVLHDWLSMGRYDRYDDLILEASRRYAVPPELIKAVIWKESRFHTRKVGSQGERGLMQVTEAAAKDWTKAEKIETFQPADLFDPKVNIEAGTWYLSRALGHWSGKDDPIPFALAEFNAGRNRVKRWVRYSGQGDVAQANDLSSAMDFPTTKIYIGMILDRVGYYRRTHEFPQEVSAGTSP